MFKLWALNDVATCYFLNGQALEGQKKSKEVLAANKFLAKSPGGLLPG